MARTRLSAQPLPADPFTCLSRSLHTWEATRAASARLRAGGEAHRGQHLYLAVPSAPGTASGKPSRVRHGRRPARAWCQRQALEGGGRAGPSPLGPGAPGEAVLLLRDKPHHLAPPPCCFWPEVLFDLRLACFSWWQKWLRALSASQDGRGVQGKTRRPAALLGWSGTSDLGGQPAAPATGQRGPRSAGWAPGSQESLTGLRGLRAGPGRRPCRQAHGGKAQGVVGCQEPHFPLVPALPVGREDSGEGRLCAQWWLRPSVGSGASSATQGGTQCHGRPGGEAGPWT